MQSKKSAPRANALGKSSIRSDSTFQLKMSETQKNINLMEKLEGCFGSYLRASLCHAGPDGEGHQEAVARGDEQDRQLQRKLFV